MNPIPVDVLVERLRARENTKRLVSSSSMCNRMFQASGKLGAGRTVWYPRPTGMQTCEDLVHAGTHEPTPCSNKTSGPPSMCFFVSATEQRHILLNAQACQHQHQRPVLLRLRLSCPRCTAATAQLSREERVVPCVPFFRQALALVSLRILILHTKLCAAQSFLSLVLPDLESGTRKEDKVKEKEVKLAAEKAIKEIRSYGFEVTILDLP